MTDINADLLQWSINFLVKKLLVGVLKMTIFQTKNKLKNCTNQLLENLIREKDTHLFGVLILMMRNY